MADNQSRLQLIWGVLLVAAGIGVFFRVPQVMPKIVQIEQFSSLTAYIRFCFYFVGIFLIGGGSKKIYGFYTRNPNLEQQEQSKCTR